MSNRGIESFSQLLVMGLLSIFLLVTNAGALEQDDRATLQAQRQALQDKVAAFKQEHAFLLFQKEMYAADSKYLLFNIAQKSGQLKYKSKVLKQFSFSAQKRSLTGAGGMLVLTKKTAEQKDRFTLRFGTALVLQWKRDGESKWEAGIPVLSLDEKDMHSIFLAVEEGALAYIVR